MKDDKLVFLNKKIQSPLRYIGGEINSVVKDSAPASILLAFPDVYEIGMSHYGSRILYEIVNYGSPYSMERVYMPWKDVVDEMRKKEFVLGSIETGKKLKNFDAVGFSMQNELCYTNVLAMLDLGGVDLFSSNRNDNDPIIIAGGGATYNPAPMSKFIDAFVIGEAEELIIKVMDVLSNNKKRADRLSALSKLDGVYVPLIHSDQVVIQKAVLCSLDNSAVLDHPLVPYMDLVHDRITYEIQRGCARGCRFCQAGVIYRPIRQRDPNDILKMVEKNIADTGYRDIGFLSLNACDYSPLLRLVSEIYEMFKGQGMFVSLPSLRIESISPEFLNTLSKLPKSGFTIAPEAGSSRIRKVINKNMSDEEIFETVKLVSSMNWDSIKSYFMIGLPTEQDEDIEAIVTLARNMEKIVLAKRCRLSISVSNFVPKPQTPFQWEKQLCWEEFQDRIHFLLSKVKGKKLSLKWGDAKMSEIEGILCRGDKKVSELILSVYKKGEMFTSWGSEFDYSKWESSIKELGLDKNYYLGARDINSNLPWDNISCGVTKEWLKQERQKAFNLQETLDCTKQECSACRVCSSSNLSNVIVDDKISKEALEIKNNNENYLNKKFRIRTLLCKESNFRWMGHFEFMGAVERAILRSKMPVSFSKGFKPVAEVSYAPPVGMGVESFIEPADFYLLEDIDEQSFVSRLNACLPKELRVKKAWKVPLSAPSLYQDIQSTLWTAILPFNNEYLNKDIVDSWKNKTVEVTRKGDIRKIRLADFVQSFSALAEGDKIVATFSLKMDQGKTIKPSTLLSAVFFGLDLDSVYLTRRGLVINGINFDN